MIATLVDVGALWRTIWTAAVGGLLITITCSFAVLGAARAQEHKSAGTAVGRWVLLSATGTAALAAVVAYGLYLVVR